MLYTRRQALQFLASSAAILSNASSHLAIPQLFAQDASVTPRGEVTHFKAMSFNIWVDGKQGGVPQTAEVIKQSQADIVGLQEVSNSGEELEKLTGLTFVRQKKGGILTRFLVVEASPNGLGVKLEISPSKELWFFNTHLFHAPYQPYQLAGIPYGEGNPFIKTEKEAIAEANRARGAETALLLEDMKEALASNLPVLVTGDFNEPSHLDWTDAVQKAGRVPVSVQWPQSYAMEKAGLKDAFRLIHPDPLAKPGYTWTPRPSKRDVPDRIDFVLSHGIQPTAAHIVGESKEYADIVVTPYPSDHRAVLVDFEWK